MNEAALTLFTPQQRLGTLEGAAEARRVMDGLAGSRGVGGCREWDSDSNDRVCMQEREGLFSSDRATSDLLH